MKAADEWPLVQVNPAFLDYLVELSAVRTVDRVLYEVHPDAAASLVRTGLARQSGRGPARSDAWRRWRREGPAIHITADVPEASAHAGEWAYLYDDPATSVVFVREGGPAARAALVDAADHGRLVLPPDARAALRSAAGPGQSPPARRGRLVLVR